MDQKLRNWARHPKRASTWFLRGGPGQGKSTTGQYFCQVQRAAFILLAHEKEDALELKLTPAIYELARKVKQSAEASDSWPTVPRIPLQVELKGYAKWYGDISATNAHGGILSYVCNKLSREIEQDVRVGALKRVLKQHRWVAIFDGLDEVPQDVKNGVAEEVVKFITEVAVEEDCDLLTLCTSRPQGYSGQFSQLECVSTDLLPLDIDRALKCARPLLSFNQSPEESLRAIEVLESASHSNAVRELLVTPLQVTILAHIVLSGEKPPARRWKLYDRFYEVSRRREANKSLPDPALARVLNEEEKVLKVLHNRLGLILHANAEKSDGAETSLQRDAFHALVERTVEERSDQNVVQRVDLLDRATVERLVLISTPDDKSRLRFDVRPLQEFFAAECLYEDTEASDVGARLLEIAGDVHWSEVCHFLLSALIEENRRTELRVVTTVLSDLDELETDDNPRTIRRRAGIGALLCIRLLSEGLLDKPARERFRNCLSPAMGFANSRRLATLIGMAPEEESTSWLVRYLLERLQTLAFEENIGAAIVLTHTLESNDSDSVVELTERLLKAPGPYIGAIIESFEELSRGTTHAIMPIWFHVLLVERLARADWGDLGSRAIALAVKSILTRGLPESGFSGAGDAIDCLSLLRFFALQTDEEKNGNPSANMSLSVPDFETAIEEAMEFVPPELLERAAPGLFGIIQRAIQFYKAPARKNYQELVSAMPSSQIELPTAMWDALGIPVASVSGGNSWHDISSGVSKMTDEEFVQWRMRMTASRVPWPRPDMYFNPEPTIQIHMEDIIACYRKYPSYTLTYSTLSYEERKPFDFTGDLTEIVEQLLPAIEKDPSPLAKAPWTWRALLTESNPHFETLIRVLSDECEKLLPYVRDVHYAQPFHKCGETESFRAVLHVAGTLRAPSLIPFVTDMYMNNLTMSRESTFGYVGGQIAMHNASEALIEQCRSNLSDFVVNSSYDWSVRCTSAAFLTLIEKGNDAPVCEVANLFIEHCDSGNGRWLLDALVASLSSRKQTPALRRFLSDLFDKCCSDYSARAVLERVLLVWSEVSGAPVTTQGLRDNWVYGTGG